MALGGGVKYGEQQQFQSDQAGAPMGAPAGPPPAPVPSASPQPQPTSLSAPTANPNEPVTAGANAGPGPDQGALNLPKGDTPAQLKAMYGPILPALVAESQSQYATQSYKDSVAALLALF
jgi:hypothetical protein